MFLKFSGFVGLMLFVLNTSAFAKINIKPGQWKVTTEFEKDGKKINPQAEIEKALAAVPPEQRAQMEAMIKGMAEKKGVAIGSGGAGMNVCFTKAMLEDPKNLNPENDKNCENKITEQSAKKIAMEFKCKNGSSGKGTWKIVDQENYTGEMAMKDENGTQGKVHFTGKFVTTKCKDKA